MMPHLYLDPGGGSCHLPVVLQNASHIITQSVRDGPPLVLGESHPGVIVVDAEFSMEITGILYSKLESPSPFVQNTGQVSKYLE